MPKRLAWTDKFKAEILEYEEPALESKQVRIKMTSASGKHGTTFAMFDGGVFNGSPAIDGNHILIRSDNFLYCIGN